MLKGDPTEGALAVLAAKLGSSAKSLEGLYQRVKEFPFDSERKRMSVLVTHQGGRLICTKGAPDLLMEQCAYVLVGRQGRSVHGDAEAESGRSGGEAWPQARCACSALPIGI